MNKQHWQDWVNFLLGLWVIISPWTIAHVMASPRNPFGVTEAAMWNHYIVGVAVAGLAVVALSAFALWEEWINVVLGAWLLISPWLLGFNTSTALTWNAVIIGVIILWFAAWALTDERGQKPATR